MLPKIRREFVFQLHEQVVADTENNVLHILLAIETMYGINTDLRDKRKRAARFKEKAALWEGVHKMCRDTFKIDGKCHTVVTISETVDIHWFPTNDTPRLLIVHERINK